MVYITIPDNEGNEKKFLSLPLTFGLKKALTRYMLKRDQIVEESKQEDAGKSGDATREISQKYSKLEDDVNYLFDEKASIILRAFGGQFTLDDLDRAEADEIDLVMARLQLEATGYSKKNALTEELQTNG